MRRKPLLLAAAVLLSLLFAACGGDDSDSGGVDEPPPVATREQFPEASGKTIADLLAELGEGGPVLAPSGQEFRTGKNRFGFALFDRSRAQITDAAVAVYVAPAGGGEARGPFPARYEPLDVEPAFQSRQTSADPDAAKSIYTAQIPFEEPGQYDVIGIARLDNRLVAATTPGGGVVVSRPANDPIPAPGERPPRIDTPTEADAGGDLASIDTRLPPSSMHEESFADVLGEKPVVLLFATPQLCQSRVCGPVVDIAEQVKADVGDRVEFIHMEVFRDNRIDRGPRPQFSAFNLTTEPWLFTFDESGRVAARIEGAYSERELRGAIRKATS